MKKPAAKLSLTRQTLLSLAANSPTPTAPSRRAPALRPQFPATTARRCRPEKRPARKLCRPNNFRGQSRLPGATPPKFLGTPPSSWGTPPTSWSTPPTSWGTPPTSWSTPPTSWSTPPTSWGDPPTSWGTPPTIGPAPSTVEAGPVANFWTVCQIRKWPAKNFSARQFLIWQAKNFLAHQLFFGAPIYFLSVDPAGIVP